MLLESMKRSIWGLTFFASVIFVQCSQKELFGQDKLTTFGARNSASAGEISAGRNKRDDDDSEHLLMNGQTPIEYLHGGDGFIVKEDTPVWLARRNQGKRVFSRVSTPTNVIKKAIDWWETQQSKKAYGNLTRTIELLDPHIRYSSVLAVLDYDGPFPTSNSTKQEKWIYDKILYALAFWNGVDLQLRIINNPAVRLRLVGIVLGCTRKVFPYIYKNEDIGGLDAEVAIVPMMSYWRSLVKKNSNFKNLGFDTVATITQAKRRGQYSPTWSEPTAADTRSPCLGSAHGINGIIVHDAWDFSGLQPAVHSIARTLGAERWGLCNVEGTVMQPASGTQFAGYGRRWSACTLEQIATHLLKHSSCLTIPHDYGTLGKPVKSILPGMLMSYKDVCQLHVKLTYDPYDCFKHMTNSPCGKIMCAEDTWRYSPCRGIGVIVTDGSRCDGGFDATWEKICLNGECVNNPGI